MPRKAAHYWCEGGGLGIGIGGNRLFIELGRPGNLLYNLDAVRAVDTEVYSIKIAVHVVIRDLKKASLDIELSIRIKSQSSAPVREWVLGETGVVNNRTNLPVDTVVDVIIIQRRLGEIVARAESANFECAEIVPKFLFQREIVKRDGLAAVNLDRVVDATDVRPDRFADSINAVDVDGGSLPAYKLLPIEGQAKIDVLRIFGTGLANSPRRIARNDRGIDDIRCDGPRTPIATASRPNCRSNWGLPKTRHQWMDWKPRGRCRREHEIEILRGSLLLPANT